jgi:hypothetical protein
MQADRAIAEPELRLQERHHVALHVDRIEIEAGEQPGVPGGARKVGYVDRSQFTLDWR